jgi:hypothetical protein
MKQFLKKRWTIPVATMVLTLSIGSAAFAATGSSATTVTSGTSSAGTSATATAPAGATSSNPWGNQRTDETLLTGDTLAQVKAVVVAKVGSDATIVRIESDSDASLSGHAAYEAHIVTAAGVAETVYVDKSYNYVSTETQQAGGHGNGTAPSGSAAQSGTSGTDSSDAASATPSSSSTSSSITG